MILPSWDGWHLVGTYPDGAPDDVGCWILHHEGEAMLLELPEGLRVEDVVRSLRTLGAGLRYVTASHEHEDHFDEAAIAAVLKKFSAAEFITPSSVRGDRLLHLSGEPLWLIKAPKHSTADVVTVFRGVAMTGDIELGMLESVNNEVSRQTKIKSLTRLQEFPARTGYHVHSTVSAHVNDVRTGVDWGRLFEWRS